MNSFSPLSLFQRFRISTMLIQDYSMLADSSIEFYYVFLISLMQAVTLIRASKESFNICFRSFNRCHDFVHAYGIEV